MKTYIVEETKLGKTIAVISGCGRNRGTWDTAANTKRTAQRWAADLRKQYPKRQFTVSTAL